jgi:hypothetical protein
MDVITDEDTFATSDFANNKAPIIALVSGFAFTVKQAELKHYRRNEGAFFD